MIEKLLPQNHTAVQEEDQHGIVTSIVRTVNCDYYIIKLLFLHNLLAS